MANTPEHKDIMQDMMQQSDGNRLSITPEEMEAGANEIAAAQGSLLSPEGSAVYMGLMKLIEKDWIPEDIITLLFNSGSWYKYR
ncbi:hypothetical protein [Chitinophaga solisilvae]|uniref:hypothetical protein n=1 Tax=Chitinophaga solisilvae TaxID=1233460 RepID=UPI001371F5B0|nr:hypothetical protein [Chitinophaga solisilvae]